MSTHNIGFYEDLTKISFNYTQISSNTHLISSAGSSKTNQQSTFGLAEDIDQPEHPLSPNNVLLFY